MKTDSIDISDSFLLVIETDKREPHVITVDTAGTLNKYSQSSYFMRMGPLRAGPDVHMYTSTPNAHRVRDAWVRSGGVYTGNERVR